MIKIVGKRQYNIMFCPLIFIYFIKRLLWTTYNFLMVFNLYIHFNSKCLFLFER